MMTPLVNRKIFQRGGCCRLRGQQLLDMHRSCCCTHLEGWQGPTATPLVHPRHWDTLWEWHQKPQLAQLVQEGVSGLMFCNTQGAEENISSDFFFKLHIISTPLPWTFAIEIEAHLDLVFWSKSRGKWKLFLVLLCCPADLQMGLPRPLRPRGQGKASGEGQELGWNRNAKRPRDEKAPKRPYCLWGPIKPWVLSSL